MRAALLTALAFAIPAAAFAMPQHGVLPWTDKRPQTRNPALLRTTMVSAHNEARRQYGVGPLAWDEALARDAAAYANRLARTNRFEHDPQAGRQPRQGENLWMGTRSAYSYAEMIGLLVDERKYYRPGRFPAVSRTGNWSHVSHYTQIVWSWSQRVGCATASNRTNDYLVCRYLPAGNVVGTVLRLSLPSHSRDLLTTVRAKSRAMKRAIALALLLVAPATGATLPNPNWPSPADRGEALMRQSVLAAHNGARVRFGVPALAWSDALAAKAMVHAQYMAETGVYGHDRTPGRRKTMGENLWRGQRGHFSYDVMVGTMLAEARNFRPGAFPNNSATGNWQDVAHYTQIVWPTTTEVGCALASSATTDYFVCRYAPTGNKDGFYLAQQRELAQGGN